MLLVQEIKDPVEFNRVIVEISESDTSATVRPRYYTITFYIYIYIYIFIFIAIDLSLSLPLSPSVPCVCTFESSNFYLSDMYKDIFISLCEPLEG